MRVLHSGDWHLTSKGTIAGRILMRDGMTEVLRDKANAVGRICDYAESNPIDLITIAGDIYDAADPDSASIRVGVEAIQRLSEQAPIVIVKGNHDGSKASELANALASLVGREKQGVYISERPEILNLMIRGKRVQIFTLPYPRKSHLLMDPKFKDLTPEELNRHVSELMEEILAGFRAEIDRNALNLLIGHFTVSGGRYSPGQLAPLWDVTIKKEFLEPFDIVCLGHLHDSQEFYSGTITRSGFDEEGLKVGFKVMHTYANKSANLNDEVIPFILEEEFIELPSRQFFTFNFEQFMNDHLHEHLKREDAIRIKDKVGRPEYEALIRKIKGLDFPFIKNAVEVESEIVRIGEGDGNGTEELSIEELLKLWAQNKPGATQSVNALIGKSKEIERRWRAT